MGRRSAARARRWSWLVAGVLLTIGGTHAVPFAAPPVTIVVAGSGTNLPAARALGDAYQRRHAGVRVETPSSIGSTGAIRAVADGAITIGVIARALRDDEGTLGLTVVPYARTAVVIGAHPGVPDPGVSGSDLVAIYAGRKSRWANGRRIVVLAREAGAGSIETLERVVPGFREVYADSHRAKRWSILFSGADMARALSRIPNAIGITDLGALTAGRPAIKALHLDGVAPTLDHIRAGRYRLVKPLALVFRGERLSPAERGFVDFALSREGVAVLGANGYLPATGP